MAGRSKVLTWTLPVVGLVSLAAGAGFVAQNRPVVSEEEPPRQPTTAPSVAENIDVSSYIGAIGTSEPAGEAIAIAAHVSGVVEAVHVAVGDSVGVGDALFTVERSRAEAEVALKAAEVVVRESELASLRASVPPLRAAVRSAEASLASAEADRGVAESDLADRRNLLEIATSVSDPRAIAREEVDRRRFAVGQAEAKVATAVAAVERGRAGVAQASAELARFVEPEGGADGPELLAAAARVTEAERELGRARADAALLTVRSTIDGRVLQMNTRPGEFAPASVATEGLVVLGRSGRTHVRVEVDEVDIPRFSPEARAWASPRGDASTRMVMELVVVEPLVVPKRRLSGRTSELVDTRVLQVVYAIDEDLQTIGLGRQFDVYIEAAGGDS